MSDRVTEIDGGYYLLSQDLMRGGMYTHTAADPDAIPQRVLDGVNIIQNVPWRINATILDTMRECWLAGGYDGVVPPAENEMLPAEFPQDQWDKMSKEERGDHIFARSQVHARNGRLQGKREAFLRKLEVAETFRDEPEMWFPHFLDFRGRVYPLPQDLNPQGDDIAKGLLMFAEGKPLGETGLYWLAVRLANTFGQDKLSFDARMDWVLENEEAILDSARDPLDGGRFWTTADEPWCFLATCIEWDMAHQSGDPKQFPSHLPIPLDGTCNGLQHLSLMGRDPVGALATNCADVGERHDLYQTVADEVQRLVSQDAVDGNTDAHWWITEGVTRATVKRAVMTTPYGVTPRGIRDQLIKDGHVKADADRSVASYMQVKIVEALSNTVSSAKEIMGYFQTIAGILAEQNVPLRWKVPTGLEVTQSYWKLEAKELRTIMGKLRVVNEDSERGLAVRKQMLSSAPNIVHSFDAAMLIETTLRCYDNGITSFAFIHDSYATHAADTDALAATLRRVAYDFYSTDRLQEFHEYVASYVPEGVELPDPPERGDFDVSEVLRAPYFFA